MGKRILLLFVLCLCAVNSIAQESSEETILDQIKWQEGPCISNLGNIAEIRVPGGFVFANGADTRLLMEAMQNIPSGEEVGFVAPAMLEWFLVFDFSEVGYIKDDEKSSLDSDAMLKSIKAGNEASNKEKQKRGWETMEIMGWEQPPRYNTETNNLEWATKFRSKEGVTVNWNTRLLGRTGVMSVTLVSSEEEVASILPEHNKILSGFDYKADRRYAEYRQGDKIAKYGLSALVVGGSAAVAAKTGLLKYAGKFLVFTFVAIAAFFKSAWEKIVNLFKRKK